MKQFIRNLLKGLGLYYGLLFAYHRMLHSILKVKYRILYRQYKGYGFSCNVCGAVYSKFVPDFPAAENKNSLLNNKVIAGYGENILCPACLSNARERLVIAYLADAFFLTGKNVLHLAPEKNVFKYLKQNAIITTADFRPELYKNVDGNIQKQDATCFSFENKMFDVVIANHILEHIPDDKKAMSEIFRIMTPGAVAILQVPYSESISKTIEDPFINDPDKQSALFGQKDHVRIYLLTDYIDRLRHAGFLVELLPESKLNQYSKFATQPLEKLLKIMKPL